MRVSAGHHVVNTGDGLGIFNGVLDEAMIFQAPFTEKTIVNTGSVQSMPFNYDNAFGPSEATLALEGQDWSASGIQTLSIAFAGTAGNTGTLYVKINNTQILYDQDPADIARFSLD